MTEAQVIAMIQQYIVENHNEEITANVLRPILEAMVSQPNDLIGDLDSLTTTYKNDLVGAINEVHTLSQNGLTIHYGTDLPNDVPPAGQALGDFYAQIDNTDVISFWQYNGNEWIEIKEVTGVQTVTGDGVDNTDPDNPVLTYPTPSEIGATEEAPSDGKQYARKDENWSEVVIPSSGVQTVTGDGVSGTSEDVVLIFPTLQEVADKGNSYDESIIAKRFEFPNNEVVRIGKETCVLGDSNTGVYIGYRSGGLRNAKRDNIAIGRFTLYNNGASTNNIAIGQNINYSGLPSQHRTINESVLLGHNIESSLDTDNVIAIGNGIVYGESNIAIIGNDDIVKTILKGVIEAPLATIALINTLGAKALITKEYADANYSGGGSGGSGVQTVTGDGVDNTDPDNPVLTFPTPLEIGAETTSQLNTRDTNNRKRANHTGTQLASTISDFFAQVRATVLTGISFASATAVTASDSILSAIGKLQAQTTLNNAKVTNATHTGDVTGSTELTIGDGKVTNGKLANVPTKTFKGRTASGTGAVKDLTKTEALGILNVEDGAQVNPTEIPEAEILTGTSSTLRAITARRLAFLVSNIPTPPEEVIIGNSQGLGIVTGSINIDLSTKSHFILKTANALITLTGLPPSGKTFSKTMKIDSGVPEATVGFTNSTREYGEYNVDKTNIITILCNGSEVDIFFSQPN